MARVDVFLNRTRCDFQEVSGLPLQLTVAIDKFLDVDSRLTGSRLDGAVKKLVIPATRTNSEILQGFWQPGSRGDDSIDCLVEVDGQPIFAGKARPSSVLRTWTAPKQYTLDLYGGSGGPLSDLEGLLLSDVEMGTTTSGPSAMVSTWSHNFTSNSTNVTFAPVIYGKPEGAGSTPNYMSQLDLRPHITYTHIFESIFQGHLGYKINSTFHETEAFRRCHYIFGVGNQWKRADSISGYQFEYNLSTGTSGTVGLPTLVEFSSAVSDPNSMWDGTRFTAPIDGWYSFEWEYVLTGIAGLNVAIRTSGARSHHFIEWEGVKAGGDYVWRVKLQPEFYQAGTRYAEFGIIGNMVQTAKEVSGYIKGELHDIGTPGASIDLKTCLHRNQVKDFLRGVFHQFNLAGRFDLISKQFYYEPRMAYEYSSSYGSGHAGSFSMTTGEGYYNRPLTAYDDWQAKIDPEDINVEKLFPFKDSLVLSYKKPKDAVSKLVLKEADDSINGLRSEVPLYGVKYPMGSAELGTVTSENPYFHPLPNVAAAGIQPGANLPACLPNTYKEGEVLPEATFEFPPTCAFYYGLSANDDWNYSGTDRRLPMMYMQPPQGGSDFVRFQDCLTYGDTGSSINSVIGENRGLVRNYYLNYLQCVKHGEVLTATIKLRPEEVFSETFRKPKYFLDSYWILTKIVKYNPLTHLAKAEFYRYTYGIEPSEFQELESNMSTVYNTLTTK
jgi:hypothetical protein